jgi:hypothetical protein
MLEKFSEAIDLFLNNMVLIGMIALTYIPFEALIISSMGSGPSGFFSPSTSVWLLVSLLVSLVLIGAMNFALNEIKSNRPVNYLTAMQKGLQRMGPIFLAGVVSGLLIIGGLFLLIVPGIYLALRFALVMPIVAVDNPGIGEALKRSGEMMMGHKIEMFGAWVLFLVAVILVQIVVSVALAFIVPEGNFWVELAVSSIIQLMSAVMQILIFLYYWQGLQNRESAESNPDQPESEEQSMLV